MRILALMAAFALVSIAPVQAGEGRSLSLSGVDQKLPGSLGKAAETPKLVEAPKPPEPPKPPETPKAETPATAAPAQAVEAPKEQPTFVQRPSVVGTKPAENREGQVTFDERKPAPPAATAMDKPKQAKAEKPRRKRQHWDEARIMREISRYSGYVEMIGGW